MRRSFTFALLTAVSALLGYVTWQATLTLRVLDRVERDRDGWQRPGPVIDALDLRAGHTVVDLGAGAGYFALKLAPMVGPSGSVVATDLRLESLAFLWVRARLRGDTQLRVVHADERDPRLPAGAVDAVLVSNTYHELSGRREIIAVVRQRLKPGGRLVILDRAPRADDDARRGNAAVHHDLAPAVVETEVRDAGFTILSRDDRFIDRAGDDDIWWLLVAQKP